MIKQHLKKVFCYFGYEIARNRSRNRLDLSRLSGNDCLVAGPFLGEFGWELMQWQGFIRQLAKFYKSTIVYGRWCSRYFYEDFADQYVGLDINSWDTNAYELKDFDYEAWGAGFKDVDLVLADNRCMALRDTFDQDFVVFGKVSALNSYDVVVHARSIPVLDGNKTKAKRNWITDRWEELGINLPPLRIAAVGVPELSYCPSYADDLRGIETEQLCSVLASSTVCVGPSSGLMHLAALCETPQLVWTSKDYIGNFGGSAYRYIRSWNPFATRVRVLTDGGFDPSPEYVRKELLQFLDALA